MLRADFICQAALGLASAQGPPLLTSEAQNPLLLSATHVL